MPTSLLMEKGKGKETTQSESNTKEDVKPSDTSSALRIFLQQLVLKDSFSSPKTTEERESSSLNTSTQVVQKIAHKEPALLYFYHKLFPNVDPVTEKVVIDMVAKVVQDAKESAKSPKMKPRSYVPPKIGRSRTSDHFGNEEDARKLVLLSNLQALLREAIMLNELQEESHLNVQKIGIGRRVDVPYIPVLTSEGNSTRELNEQQNQGTPSLNTTVKNQEENFLPPPPPRLVDIKFEESSQKDSRSTQADAATSKGKVAETENVQENQVILASNFNPVRVKVEKGRDLLSDTVTDSLIKGNDDQTNFKSTQPSKSKGEVTGQKDRAPSSGPSATDKLEGDFPPPPLRPPVVDLKIDESGKKDSKPTKTERKVAETTSNKQSSQTTPIASSNQVNKKDKAALSEFVINFISKEDAQQYFKYNPASISNGKSTEKLNGQTGAASSTNIKEKVVPAGLGAADLKSNRTDTFAQRSTFNTGKSAEKVNAHGAASNLNSKENDQKHIKSTQASTSNGNIKVEKEAAPPPPPGNAQKQPGSTHSSTSNGKSTSDHINVKVEESKRPTSPPPIRCKPKVEDISHQEEIYVTSAHARERTDKSRLRQGHFGGRVVPKPEPVNSNSTQGTAKSSPTEKGKENEERKPEPSRADSSTTAKPESKPADSNGSKYNSTSSSSKTSSGIQTDPVKEYKSTGTSSTSSSQFPRGETRSEYPAASSPPPPKAKSSNYGGNYDERKSSNSYGYKQPSPALGASFAARCSGTTRENRQCLIVVHTIFDGENLKPFCEWHGAYYGSGKPKSLDPNKKEIGRCSATTQYHTLCTRPADYYGSTGTKYGYCWQHERMYGFRR